MTAHYPIGTPGQPWGAAEKQAWKATQQIKRQYKIEVVDKIKQLTANFDLKQYGALSYDPERYPLFYLQSKTILPNKPYILITGGVHGYETSGVQGAIKFIAERTAAYNADFNFIIVPCVSPWGYEVINRWNPLAIDPNRSFYADSPAEEAAALMTLIAQLDIDFLAHIDLHETTDTDETEFRPALAARDGIDIPSSMIPDGFYAVDNAENPQVDFQKAIIESVSKVTHIAPPDDKGEIIGSTLYDNGVIRYPLKKLGLCASVTNAPYTCTTEVYPDSIKVNGAICNLAQVAAICGALDFLKQTAS